MPPQESGLNIPQGHGVNAVALFFGAHDHQVTVVSRMPHASFLAAVVALKAFLVAAKGFALGAP